MGTSMKCEKRSLALLSSKRTKAYTRSKADEAFALPSFSDQAIPHIRETKVEQHVYASLSNDVIPLPAVAASCEHNGHDVEHDGRNAKHHRHDLEPDGHDVKCHVNNNEPDVDNDGCDVDIDGHVDTDGRDKGYRTYGVKYNGLDVLMNGCDVKHNGYDVQHNRHVMEQHDGHNVRHQGHDVGHEGHDVAFDDGHDVEQLKQTMLKHESIFKEQLCELHRLYQVQRSLMAEVDRQEDSSSNPHIDPSSSNGSLLSNQTLFKEKNLFNANHDAEAKLNINEKQSFFSKNLDINKVFDDVENTEMPSLAMNKARNRRILLDLERPAEEYVDEVEEEKCQNFPVSHKRKMSESKGLWNFHGGKDDNMGKEVSYTAKEAGFQGSHINSSQVSPPSRGIYSGGPTIEDKLNGPQLFGCELGHNSQGTSNLPHWLLQASPEVKNTPPSHSVSFASSGQQQKLSFFTHKHEDVNHQQARNLHSNFRERTKSVGTDNVPQHWLSNGKGLQEQQFSREPRNIVSGFVASTKDKINSSSHLMDEKHVATSLAQPFVNTHTTAHDTRVSQNVILNRRELESGSKLPPWLQNFSTGQQALKPSNRIQQLSCISSLNQWSSIQTSPSQQAYSRLQQANNPSLQAASLSTTSEHAMEGLEVSWTEILSKRSNISPMKSSSPALADDNIGGVKRGLAPIMTSSLQTSENVGLLRKGPQKHDRINPTKASFDLNVTVDESPNEKGMEANKGWFAKLGIKASCQEKPKAMKGSLYVEGTSFLDCSGKDLPKNVAENAECIDVGSDAGAHCEGGKSSDGSGITSVESQEAMHLIKVIEDSNASSGDQSGDSSRNSNIIQLDDSMGMLCREACIMTRNKHQTIGSSVTFAFPHDLNEECVVVDDHYHHFGSIHGAPSKLDTEAAHVLLWLGSDLPSLVAEDSSLFKKDEERSLKWLADIIPEEGSVEMTSMDVDGNRHSELSLSEGSSGLDSFELLVLSTKPIDPEDIELSTPPIESSAIDPTEEPSPPPVSNPRRRSSRRGKANKDFKREILPSVACLSRQEVTEDLQIIEGLIKSARETTGAYDSSPKEEGECFVMPDAGSTKNNIIKAKGGGSKTSRGLKPNPKALLRVCSWGESTRRKRMSRQRSQWSCLPPSVL